MRVARAIYWQNRVHQLLMRRGSHLVRWFRPSRYVRFPIYHPAALRAGARVMAAKDREWHMSETLQAVILLAQTVQAAPYFGC